MNNDDSELLNELKADRTRQDAERDRRREVERKEHTAYVTKDLTS